MPRQPQLKVRGFGVFLGLVFLLPGLYLALVWLPDHDLARIKTVGSAVNAVARNATYLKPELMQSAKFFAWGLVALGVAQLVTGSLRRDGIIGYCKKCDMSVNARRSAFGNLLCERCRGRVTK